MSKLLISKINYKYDPWEIKFENDNQVDILKLKLNLTWKYFIKNLDINIINKINELLTNDKINIFPYPDLLFYGLNLTPLNKTKVVILGQDPYFNYEELNNNKNIIIPQSMGLSFSVPVEIQIPISLINIFKNLLKYKHISKMPIHGNLAFWAIQGVLMLNTSLTVKHKNPNSHSAEWEPLTDELIKYISSCLDHVIFVLWGTSALEKKKLIDENKHTVLITSHPSGLSCNNSLRQYPAFNDYDHFGQINQDLKKHNKRQIIWQNNF